jgi:hypothetical protein
MSGKIPLKIISFRAIQMHQLMMIIVSMKKLTHNWSLREERTCIGKGLLER